MLLKKNSSFSENIDFHPPSDGRKCTKLSSMVGEKNIFRIFRSSLEGSTPGGLRMMMHDDEVDDGGTAGFQFSLSNAGEGKSNGSKYIVRVVNGGELF